MFAEERYVRIIEWINRTGKATVNELSELLHVSPVTVRRDLEKLEERKLLIRTHGGAISAASDLGGRSRERSIEEKREALSAEKKRIAETAAQLVNEGDTILLTPGTTNMMLASKLTGKPHLTIVTNALNIAFSVTNAADADVIFLGGGIRKKSMAAVGPIAEDGLAHIRVDKLFLGVDGIDLQEGLTTPNLSEANINRKMISIARQVIVVADRSKFGKVWFSHISPLSAVQTVITDHEVDPNYIQQLRHMEIQLLLA